ncbi:hypothetical protein Q1695_008458 [Nippostrongylus brasiliensis]|nr:hypothetical protein Q1695_008458 [Nippostrongylus brasiliensis]
MALIIRENNILRFRCFTHLGDISYTLYLIHWPIYCWIRFSGHKNSTAYRTGGLACAWFLSVLLTRTFERWYRAANKATVLTIIAALYVLTVYAAITLNTKFTFNEFRSLWYDRCDYINEFTIRKIGDPNWWCTFKDMNESASVSALIIGNSWAANHARIIHKGCRNQLKSMTLFSYAACEVLVQTHTYHSCSSAHGRYDEIIQKIRPDYLFVIARHLELLPNLNQTSQTTDIYSLCLDKQVFARIQRIQKPVKKKVFILDALPRTVQGYLKTLNSKLVKHQPVNQTEFIEPTKLEFARSILRRAVKLCQKCSLISYDSIFGAGKSFQVFDPQSKVAYFTNGNHLTAAGLWKIAPVYERLCGSF